MSVSKKYCKQKLLPRSLFITIIYLYVGKRGVFWCCSPI